VLFGLRLFSPTSNTLIVSLYASRACVEYISNTIFCLSSDLAMFYPSKEILFFTTFCFADDLFIFELQQSVLVFIPVSSYFAQVSIGSPYCIILFYFSKFLLDPMVFFFVNTIL